MFYEWEWYPLIRYLKDPSLRIKMSYMRNRVSQDTKDKIYDFPYSSAVKNNFLFIN